MFQYKTVLFAVYITGKQISEIYKDMNNERQILADWFCANKLFLNISKTKYPGVRCFLEYAKNTVRSIQPNKQTNRLYNINFCIITSTGVCHIHYLISLHLPMISILIEQDKRAIYILSLALLKELQTVYSVTV